MHIFSDYPRKFVVPTAKCPFYNTIINQDVEGLLLETKKDHSEKIPKGWTEDEFKEALDLVIKLMHPDPNQRISCEETLLHPFCKNRE